MKVYAICANDAVMGIVAADAGTEEEVEQMAHADYEKDLGHWRSEWMERGRRMYRTAYAYYRSRLYWHTHGPFELITKEQV